MGANISNLLAPILKIRKINRCLIQFYADGFPIGRDYGFQWFSV